MHQIKCWSKFIDIPVGYWFQDKCSGKTRKMLKISFCANELMRDKLTLRLMDKLTGFIRPPLEFNSDRDHGYNAIDIKGILCQCPDWVKFYVLGPKNGLRD